MANYLADHGVERAGRIGVNIGQRPAALLGHIAAWKLGAVSVPLSTLFGPDALAYHLGDCDAVACLVDETNIEAFRTANAELDTLDTVLTVGDVDRRSSERDLHESLNDSSRHRENGDHSGRR